MLGLQTSYGTPGVDELAGASMIVLVVVVSARLFMCMSSWGWIQCLFFWGTLAVFQLLVLVYSSVYFPDDAPLPDSYTWNRYYGFVDTMYTHPEFWLSVLMGITLGLTLGIAAKTRSAMTHASLVSSVQSMAASVEQSQKQQLHKTLSVARMSVPEQGEMQRYLEQKARATETSNSNNGRPPKSGFAFSTDDATASNIWAASIGRRAARVVTRFRTLTHELLGTSPPRFSQGSNASHDSHDDSNGHTPPRGRNTGRTRSVSKQDKGPSPSGVTWRGRSVSRA